MVWGSVTLGCSNDALSTQSQFPASLPSCSITFLQNKNFVQSQTLAATDCDFLTDSLHLSGFAITKWQIAY